MQVVRIAAAVAVVAWGLVVASSSAGAATVPVTGWVVHNGTSTVTGTAANPIFTPGDDITIMAPFADVVLANDGDFIEGTTTLTMNTRSTTGVNTLNTQLRVGLFQNDDAVVTAGDTPNLGFTIEYTNTSPTGGLIREQTNPLQTNPFTSPTDTGVTGTPDAGGDSIQGANPGPVVFTLRLTRNAGEIDLLGSISATEPVSNDPYLATFSLTGYSSATFPANGTFTFNRIALFLGGGVNAASASLADSSITTVPEPASAALAIVASGGLLARRRTKRPSAA